MKSAWLNVSTEKKTTAWTPPPLKNWKVSVCLSLFPLSVEFSKMIKKILNKESNLMIIEKMLQDNSNLKYEILE